LTNRCIFSDARLNRFFFLSIGAVLDILLTVPFVGWFSDFVIKYFAKKRHGVHEPEVRVLPIFFPATLGFTAMILHGYQQAYPTRVHWFAQVYIFGALNFSFSAVSISTQNVLLDSYPTRAGATLIIVNTFRGALAFAFMGSFSKTIQNLGGPLPAWGTFGGVGAALMLICLGLFFYGKKIRLFTLRFVVDGDGDGGRMKDY
jgi:hypothetical protein